MNSIFILVGVVLFCLSLAMVSDHNQPLAYGFIGLTFAIITFGIGILLK